MNAVLKIIKERVMRFLYNDKKPCYVLAGSKLFARSHYDGRRGNGEDGEIGSESLPTARHSYNNSYPFQRRIVNVYD